MIQPHAPATHAGYRIKPANTHTGHHTCKRCGIDFPSNSRSIWTKQTHCRDCRWFVRRTEA